MVGEMLWRVGASWMIKFLALRRMWSWRWWMWGKAVCGWVIMPARGFLMEGIVLCTGASGCPVMVVTHLHVILGIWEAGFQVGTCVVLVGMLDSISIAWDGTTYISKQLTFANIWVVVLGRIAGKHIDHSHHHYSFGNWSQGSRLIYPSSTLGSDS